MQLLVVVAVEISRWWDETRHSRNGLGPSPGRVISDGRRRHLLPVFGSLVSALGGGGRTRPVSAPVVSEIMAISLQATVQPAQQLHFGRASRV